jgi:hypothetical protein
MAALMPNNHMTVAEVFTPKQCIELLSKHGLVLKNDGEHQLIEDEASAQGPYGESVTDAYPSGVSNRLSGVFGLRQLTWGLVDRQLTFHYRAGFDRDVLVDVRPMNPHAASDQLPVVALLSSCRG